MEYTEAQKLLLEAEQKELATFIVKLENNIESLETKYSKIIAENLEMEATITHVQSENDQLKLNMCQLQAENNLLKTENEKLKSDNYQILDEKSQLESHYQEKQFQLESRHQQEKHQLELHHQQQKQKLQSEVERFTYEQKRTMLMPIQLKDKPIFPLQLVWKRDPNLMVAMSDYIQSVEINGTVYVGGGRTDRIEDRCIVMAYNTQSCLWNTLPPYSTECFAMTAINSTLVLVGGVAINDSESSRLGKWQSNNNRWTYPFPPMTRPRWWPSATSYKHWLVVAGGCHKYQLHSSVEILDVSNMQWFTRQSTPTPWEGMKSATFGDMWYLMGGFYGSRSGTPDVYGVSLETLITHSAADTSIWKKLPSLTCRYSCPLIIDGSLVAVGGKDMKSRKPVSVIQRYVPETNMWVEAGHIPHTEYNCTCIITLDKIRVIGGDDGKTRLKSVLTSSTY